MEQKTIKTFLNRFLIAVFIAFVIIQIFHPEKNENNAITKDNIETMYPVPDSVHMILKKACYDCHSDYTNYPWYNRIQPVAWWLNDHIKKGKRHVNFSEFGKNPIEKQAKKLKKCADEIEEGGMPLDNYLWIHKDAILSNQEKDMLINWCNTLSKQIAEKK